MEFATAFFWGIGSVIVAGIVDRKGVLDLMQAQLSKRLLHEVEHEPLIFDPGNRLTKATLD